MTSVFEKGGEPKVLENDLLIINSEIQVGKKTTRMKLLQFDSIQLQFTDLLVDKRYVQKADQKQLQ